MEGEIAITVIATGFPLAGSNQVMVLISEWVCVYLYLQFMSVGWLNICLVEMVGWQYYCVFHTEGRRYNRNTGFSEGCIHSGFARFRATDTAAVHPIAASPTTTQAKLGHQECKMDDAFGIIEHLLWQNLLKDNFYAYRSLLIKTMTMFLTSSASWKSGGNCSNRDLPDDVV